MRRLNSREDGARVDQGEQLKNYYKCLGNECLDLANSSGNGNKWQEVKIETNKQTNKQTWSIGVYKCWRISWFLAKIVEIMEIISFAVWKDFQQEKSSYTHTHTHTHLGIYYIGNADIEIEMLSRESYLQI